jgi:uncharacterized membrane protein YgcG
VSVIRVPPTPRGAGRLLRAVVAAWLLVLALVVPAGAVEGPTKLFDAAASTTTGTPATTITFTATYRNREGSAPAYVRVVIDGHAHAMTSNGSSDWKQGVVFHYATKLAAGTHAVNFVAADTRKFNNQVSGGSITITIEAPAPTPTPKPTPKPDPTPTPTPKPTPGGDTGGAGGTGGGVGTIGGDGATGGTGGSGGAGGSGGPSASGSGSNDGYVDGQTWGRGTGDPREYGGSIPASTDGSSSGSGDNSTDGTQGPMAGGLLGGGAGSDGAGGSTGGPNVAPTGRSGGSGPGGSGGSGGGWGELASALSALGLQSGATPIPMLPTLVSTTGAVAMAMAFAIFGKKRRDEEQPAPDEVLEANAARASAVAASSQLAVGPAVAPVDIESTMPRWRRPSLQQARKADPTRYVATAPKLRFDESMNGIGYERRVIRYRVVSLLDAPDELRAVEIGQLDQGDEVQLLERSGAYWLVLCPDGRQGWLHKMTLGDVVADESASSADAWNVGDIDGDVLSAYLAARARA